MAELFSTWMNYLIQGPRGFARMRDRKVRQLSTLEKREGRCTLTIEAAENK